MDAIAIAVGCIFAIIVVLVGLGLAACMQSSAYTQMEERIRGKLQG